MVYHWSSILLEGQREEEERDRGRKMGDRGEGTKGGRVGERERGRKREREGVMW